MNATADSPKARIRSQMAERFRALSPEERHARSLEICQRISTLPVWRNARVVTAFEPMRSEPNIEPLINDVRARGAELISILPSARHHEQIAVLSPIDVVLVPGVAFTRAGGRVGRGGGFFDRFLAHRAARAIKIGVCFDFQIVESLPLESHDVRLDLIVSERG